MSETSQPVEGIKLALIAFISGLCLGGLVYSIGFIAKPLYAAITYQLFPTPLEGSLTNDTQKTTATIEKITVLPEDPNTLQEGKSIISHQKKTVTPHLKIIKNKGSNQAPQEQTKTRKIKVKRQVKTIRKAVKKKANRKSKKKKRKKGKKNKAKPIKKRTIKRKKKNPKKQKKPKNRKKDRYKTLEQSLGIDLIQ